MREIKFRAWHDNRVMLYWDLFGNDDTYLLDAGISVDEDEDPIMQYTGLKDKNGKEIYEGDICKAGTPITVIEWGQAGFTGIDWLFYNEGTFEVIGNIHENPELLET